MKQEEESKGNERSAKVKAAVLFYLREGGTWVRLDVKSEMELLNKLKFNYLVTLLSRTLPEPRAQKEACLAEGASLIPKQQTHIQLEDAPQ